MSALRASEIGGFIAAGCRKMPVILVHGSDEGQVRTRVRAITETILGPDAYALSLLELDAEGLAQDPARLLDEANAISMFGGHRVIVVRQAGKIPKSTWQPLFDVPPLDSTIIFQGDDLSKSAPLRQAAEQATQAAAIACYPPSQADLAELVETQLRAARQTITPVARAYLLERLGADYALSLGEVEKLVLYCKGQLAIEIDDVEACLADASSVQLSEAIDLAFEGQLEALEGAALQSFREGLHPSALLSLALNHSLMLRRLRAARRNGGLEQALRQEQVFFKRQDRVKRQSDLWDASKLARAIEILAAAQEQGRFHPRLEDAVAVRALWSIALAARRK